MRAASPKFSSSRDLSGRGLWRAGAATTVASVVVASGDAFRLSGLRAIVRMTVRSLSSGSAKGLSLMGAWSPWRPPWLSSDSPKLQAQVGKFSGDVNRETTRGLHLLPMGAVAIQLEIRGSGMERYLPWCDRQRTNADARQRHIHQLADMFHGTDLDLRREQSPQRLGRHIRLRRQNKVGAAQDGTIRQRSDPDALPPFLQRNSNRVLLDHRGQRSAQIGDHRRKAALQVLVSV